MQRAALILFLFVIMTVSAFARSVGQDYRFVYSIVDSQGAHVTGQTPSVMIEKVSTGAWLDFEDGEFKSSEWIEKSAGLSEDAVNGYYFYQFTPPASETESEQYVFVVSNTDEVYADHQAVIVDYEVTSGLSAEDVWNASVSGLPQGSAGELISKIHDATDGDRENGEYTGIEKTIRVNR